MAIHHALPGEIVDLNTWAQELPHEHTKAIVKTDEMELARLVIQAGKEFPNHKISSTIVVHCVKGKIEVTVSGAIQALKSDQLIYLLPNEPHSVRAVVDSVVLLTIFF